MHTIFVIAQRLIAGAILSLLVFGVLVGGAAIFTGYEAPEVHAQAGGGGGAIGDIFATVFGGRVEEQTFCFCREVVNVGWWIKVGPPRPGEFFLSPFFSREYEFRPINTEEWVLGTALPINIECKIDTVLYGCIKIHDGNLIRIVGSSGSL